MYAGCAAAPRRLRSCCRRRSSASRCRRSACRCWYSGAGCPLGAAPGRRVLLPTEVGDQRRVHLVRLGPGEPALGEVRDALGVDDAHLQALRVQEGRQRHAIGAGGLQTGVAGPASLALEPGQEGLEAGELVVEPVMARPFGGQERDVEGGFGDVDAEASAFHGCLRKPFGRMKRVPQVSLVHAGSPARSG